MAAVSLMCYCLGEWGNVWLYAFLNRRVESAEPGLDARGSGFAGTPAAVDTARGGPELAILPAFGCQHHSNMRALLPPRRIAIGAQAKTARAPLTPPASKLSHADRKTRRP